MKYNSDNTNIGLRHMRAAVAVAAERSFSAAAQSLGVVPSALTETVRQLEEDCGTLLFDRQSRPVRPTPAGLAFLERAHGILRAFDQTRAEMQAIGGLAQGRVAVGVAPSLIAPLLLPALVRFRAEYPGISVLVHDDVAQRIAELVLDGTLDFGLAGRWQENRELRFDPIASDPLVLVCAARHPFANLPSIALADIPAGEVISLASGTGTTRLLQEAGLPEALIHGPLTAFSTIGQLRMIAGGIGVGLMPRLAVSVTGDVDLRCIPLRDLTIRRQLFVISRDRKTLPPAAARLLARVRRAAADHQTRPSGAGHDDGPVAAG